MDTIEFHTTIDEHGHIEVPLEYRRQLQGEAVRVIIQAQAQPRRSSFIQHLLEHPRKVAGFTPLTRDEIYDRPSLDTPQQP